MLYHDDLNWLFKQGLADEWEHAQFRYDCPRVELSETLRTRFYRSRTRMTLADYFVAVAGARRVDWTTETLCTMATLGGKDVFRDGDKILYVFSEGRMMPAANVSWCMESLGGMRFTHSVWLEPPIAGQVQFRFDEDPRPMYVYEMWVYDIVQTTSWSRVDPFIHVYTSRGVCRAVENFIQTRCRVKLRWLEGLPLGE